MILAGIKTYLSSGKSATRDELARALDADREVVAQAIETWIRKGKIIAETTAPACACGCACCSTCGDLPAVYRWVG